MWFWRRKPSVDVQQLTEQLYAQNAALAMRNKTLSLLRRLDQILLAEAVPARVGQAVGALLMNEFGFSFVGLALSVDPSQPLRWLSVVCPQAVSATCAKLFPSAAVLASLRQSSHPVIRAVRAGKRVVVPGALRVFPSTITRAWQERGLQMKSAMIFPMRVGEGTAAVLVITLPRPAQTLTAYEKETLSGVVSLVAVGLQKALLYERLHSATAELYAANAKLVQLDRAKTEFVSIASHELRTPLSIIRGYINLMRDGSFGKLSKIQLATVEKIQTSAEGLIDLVNQLLNLSRIESGKITVAPKRMELKPLVKEVVELFRARAKEAHLELRERIPAAVPVVRGDGERVKEVLVNLVENAIKYTPAGSVEVRLVPEASFVRVEVSDTGAGLTAKDITLLFQKFSRTSSASMSKVPGTGLGLYVCKKLIEAMGGTIWAESPGVGKGSTFAFRVPLNTRLTAEVSPGKIPS